MAYQKHNYYGKLYKCTNVNEGLPSYKFSFNHEKDTKIWKTQYQHCSSSPIFTLSSTCFPLLFIYPLYQPHLLTFQKETFWISFEAIVCFEGVKFLQFLIYQPS